MPSEYPDPPVSPTAYGKPSAAGASTVSEEVPPVSEVGVSVLSFALLDEADSLEEPVLPEDAGADTEVPDPELPEPDGA